MHTHPCHGFGWLSILPKSRKLDRCVCHANVSSQTIICARFLDDILKVETGCKAYHNDLNLWRTTSCTAAFYVSTYTGCVFGSDFNPSSSSSFSSFFSRELQLRTLGFLTCCRHSVEISGSPKEIQGGLEALRRHLVNKVKGLQTRWNASKATPPADVLNYLSSFLARRHFLALAGLSQSICLIVWFFYFSI
jgi:hypothetical protein